uniref:Uncharacterized protein n=1 Tax=Cacopsylla melanoneura TaxID=428564 RepID=A0A8D8VV37_9HEMI
MLLHLELCHPPLTLPPLFSSSYCGKDEYLSGGCTHLPIPHSPSGGSTQCTHLPIPRSPSGGSTQCCSGAALMLSFVPFIILMSHSKCSFNVALVLPRGCRFS